VQGCWGGWWWRLAGSGVEEEGLEGRGVRGCGWEGGEGWCCGCWSKQEGLFDYYISINTQIGILSWHPLRFLRELKGRYAMDDVRCW
jgi:hypothetical protein